eukprot:265916_1
MLIIANFIQSHETVDQALLHPKLNSIHAVCSIVRSVQNILKKDIAKDIVQLILRFYHFDYIEHMLNEHTLLDRMGDVDDMKQILKRKLKLCQHRFVFTEQSLNDLKYNQAIQIKTQYLTQIIQCFSIHLYAENDIKECLGTIAINIFRPLPSLNSVHDESFTTGVWTHLRLVYELFLRLLTSSQIQSKTLKKCFDKPFIQNIINLFASEYAPEREYLKTILYRMYARVMPWRTNIRRCMANYFCRASSNEYGTVRRYEQDLHGPIPSDSDRFGCVECDTMNGISELLQIYGAVVNGFNIPLHEEHQQYLVNVIMSLFKCTNIELFHHDLTCCCCKFVQKHPSLGRAILLELLRYWPKQSASKEILFIGAVEEVMNRMVSHAYDWFKWEENKEVCLLVIDRLIECNESLHFEVAERSLVIWIESTFQELLNHDKELLWTKLVCALLKIKHHWNKEVRDMSTELLQTFQETDHELYRAICERSVSKI